MRAILLAAAAAIWAGQAGAATVTLWDEAVDGDLSYQDFEKRYTNRFWVGPVTELTTFIVYYTAGQGDGDTFTIYWGWTNKLVDLSWSLGSPTVWKDGASVFVSYSGPGYLAVDVEPAPVPLPASAPLLLVAMGLAGLIRARASRGARSTFPGQIFLR